MHAYIGLADTFACDQGWLAGWHLRVHLQGFLQDPLGQVVRDPGDGIHVLLHKEGLKVHGDWGHLIPFHCLDLILRCPGILLLFLLGLHFLGHLVWRLQPLCRFIDKDGTYLCGFLNADTLELLERGSWKMSSGWVPLVASAVKEYGLASGHIAPSYI